MVLGSAGNLVSWEMFDGMYMTGEERGEKNGTTVIA